MARPTVEFPTWNPASEKWVLGSANSYTENVSLYSGNIEGKILVLENSVRRRGSTDLYHYRDACSTCSTPIPETFP